MARNIFIVDAFQVNTSGQFQHITDFPKPFNSDSYNGDVDKALKRATGAFAAQHSAFCNADNYKIAHVTLTDIAGNQLRHEVIGILTDEPAQQTPAE